MKSKVAWLDSTGSFSHIHLTTDGVDTICGGHSNYLKNRKLVKAPKKRQGRSNFCKVCFANGGKNLKWINNLDMPINGA